MLEINVKITLAAGEEYTATEAAVVAALGGKAPAAAAAVTPPAAKATPPAAKPPVATKPPVKAPAAPKAPAKPAEPEPEEDVVDEGPAAALEDEDLLGGDAPEYTIEAAVAAATKLVSSGKPAVVKAALATAGAKKVSELKGKAIQAFLEALEG